MDPCAPSCVHAPMDVCGGEDAFYGMGIVAIFVFTSVVIALITSTPNEEPEDPITMLQPVTAYSRDPFAPSARAPSYTTTMTSGYVSSPETFIKGYFYPPTTPYVSTVYPFPLSYCTTTSPSYATLPTTRKETPYSPTPKQSTNRITYPLSELEISRGRYSTRGSTKSSGERYREVSDTEGKVQSSKGSKNDTLRANSSKASGIKDKSASDDHGASSVADESKVADDGKTSSIDHGSDKPEEVPAEVSHEEPPEEPPQEPPKEPDEEPPQELPEEEPAPEPPKETLEQPPAPPAKPKIATGAA